MKILKILFIFAVVSFVVIGCGGSGTQGTVAGSKLADINGTSDVAINSVFQAEFTKAVLGSSVTTSTFYIVTTQTTSLTAPVKSLGPKSAFDSTVCDSANALPATIACPRTTACTLTLTNTLSNSTSYTACLSTGISYADGSSFAGASYTFTTAAGGGGENPEDEGGTVTMSGTLSLTTSASVSAKSTKDVSFDSSASNYIVHILNTATGGQKTANIAADGTFSFTAGAGNNYMVNILDSDKQYVGTLATNAVSNDTVSVALTTGSDGSTTNLGTVTANTTTGQITSDQTLTADTDQLAATSGGIIAGGKTGEGTADYRTETGITCTASTADCPDYDGDGNPDIFDTNNNNNSNGYADEISGAVDLCVPAVVSLYIKNYPTLSETQPGFPTPDEVGADLGSTTMYNIITELTPNTGYTIGNFSQISVVTPAYIDSYGYVYHVASGHECFNTLWTDCNGKKLMLSDDGTKYEMSLADINLQRAGILTYMFPGDTFIYNISMTDGTEHVCTRKINIIPKYYPYALTKDGGAVDTNETLQTSWTGNITIGWSIPTQSPSGQTYNLRVVPYLADCSRNLDNYSTITGGQDVTSKIINVPNDLPSSAKNQWEFQLIATDSAGDLSETGWVMFTSESTNQCPQ